MEWLVPKANNDATIVPWPNNQNMFKAHTAFIYYEKTNYKI